MKPLTIAFVESWTNNIYLQFTKAFAEKYPQHTIYYIHDADAWELNVTFPKNVHVIKLQNIKAVRKLFFFPFYVGGFFSKKLKKMYIDSLYMHTYKGLSKTLDKIQPDLITANVILFPITHQAGRYAIKHNIPFFLRTELQRSRSLFEAILIELAMWISKPMLKHASYIMPWTTQGEAYVRHNFPVEKKKILLSPAAFNTKMMTPKKKYSTKGPIKLCTIQRYVPYKDYPTLLKGLKLAIEDGWDGTLTAIGPGPLEQEIKDLVTELGLDERVTIISEKYPYDKIPDFLRAHDAFVMTSHYEAIGIVVPESMMCGLPVVVSDTAGACTYIEKGTGYTFKTGSPEDLAKQLKKLTHASIKKMGQKASKYTRANHSVDVRAEQFHALLEREFA